MRKLHDLAMISNDYEEGD